MFSEDTIQKCKVALIFIVFYVLGGLATSNVNEPIPHNKIKENKQKDTNVQHSVMPTP